METTVMETFGVISLLPVLVVIVTAIFTKRAMESLVLGTFVAAIILEGGGWWSAWFDFALQEIGNSAYYIIMFGMFGAMIRVLDKSGSALGFADVGAKVANSRKKTSIFTWLLGIIIFVEDYLNALGVGVAMQRLTDKWKISREFLAFVVNSTGAAVCILVPFSSWGVLYAAQIDNVGILEGVSGFQAYVRAIPFMLYAWAAVIVVPLFSLGILPLFGPMKKAEARAQETGRVFPDYYYITNEAGEEVLTTGLSSDVKPSSALNFIIPMLMLIVVAVATNDIVLAVILASVTCFAMLLVQKRMTLGEFADHIVEGFKDMLYVTMLVLAAFILQNFNDALGLTPFIINSVMNILSPGLFPAITFLVVGAIAFSTGSFWGVAAISFPIILPLAVALGVNPYLAIGAVAAGTSFGSHACLYSDAVTVTCAATGLKNIDYARTSIPLIMVPMVIGILAYLVVGFAMA
ncbi:Na+/H+ antiporter NhaC family protein [Anoxynatronum sibiricum]|uniref:Na+/H+ antiporter NhaC family protein n=1 Tax=Anoxynatronum sibiricum TaxID=210623 RepID=A0ABU9W077_9CLOT